MAINEGLSTRVDIKSRVMSFWSYHELVTYKKAQIVDDIYMQQQKKEKRTSFQINMKQVSYLLHIQRNKIPISFSL